MRISNRSLGVHVPGLREFVPATWTIPENPFTPGMAGLRAFVPARFTIPPQPAGIGDFVRAKFTLPPQPAGIGDFVRARFTLPAQPAFGVGDFVGTAAMYPIPQNSVSAAVASGAYSNSPTMGIPISSLTSSFGTVNPGTSSGVSGLSGCGCGCGGHGGCGGGLGQASADLESTVSNLFTGNFSGAGTSFMSFLSDPLIGSVPTWMIGGGALLVWALFFSGGEHSRYQRAKKASGAARRAYS